MVKKKKRIGGGASLYRRRRIEGKFTKSGKSAKESLRLAEGKSFLKLFHHRKLAQDLKVRGCTTLAVQRNRKSLYGWEATVSYQKHG